LGPDYAKAARGGASDDKDCGGLIRVWVE
jgi:hypothetical protein